MNLIKKGDQMMYHKNLGTDQWKFSVKSVRLGSHLIKKEHIYAILDSTRSGITFPFYLYRRIRHIFEKYY